MKNIKQKKFDYNVVRRYRRFMHANGNLSAARIRLEQELAASEANSHRLREKLKLLDELEDYIADVPANAPRNKYAGKKLTASILDAVNTIARTEGVTATQIRKYISAQGYVSGSAKNFPISTVLTLKRLANTGRIVTTKTVDGKRLFAAKKQL